LTNRACERSIHGAQTAFPVVAEYPPGYTAAGAGEAKGNAWTRTDWQFDGNFIVFDMKTGNSVRPVCDALIPGD